LLNPPFFRTFKGLYWNIRVERISFPHLIELYHQLRNSAGAPSVFID
jgi:hypothetical protein